MEASKIKTASAKTKPAKQGASEKSGAVPRLNTRIAPEDMTTIVTVFTSGRSGTSLMASLLDAHPWRLDGLLRLLGGVLRSQIRRAD